MPDAPANVTYFWDFFGPRALGTASHFQRHLEEFLALNGIAGCRTGLASEGEGHHAVFCDAPGEHQAAIARALRPKRAMPASNTEE